MEFYRWVLPVFFLCCGFVCCWAGKGYRFLMLLSFCISGVFCCYCLLDGLSVFCPVISHGIQRFIRCLVWTVIIMYIVAGTLVVRAFKNRNPYEAQYIVILGAGLEGNAPSRILMDRIHTACRYMSENETAICIASGGQGEDESISEAQCIFSHMTATGIDPGRIWLEEKSTSTWENFRFTLRLIEEKTGQRPQYLGVISSEFHLFRACLFAQKCAVIPIGIPAKTTGFFLWLNYTLREVAGVWHYWILGGTYHD